MDYKLNFRVFYGPGFRKWLKVLEIFFRSIGNYSVKVVYIIER